MDGSALLQGCRDGRAEVRGSLHTADAGGAHGGILVLRGALTAADDRASMTHAAARRRSLAGNETDDGNLHVRLDPLRSLFFGVAPDLRSQDDGGRVGIFVEKFDGVEERRSEEGRVGK